MMTDDRKTDPETEHEAGAEPETGEDQNGPSAEAAPEEPDLQAQVDDLRDRLLRAVADAENTRKRAAREVKETREYAVTGFARDMLDVADNLGRALATLDEAARAELPPVMANFLEGVEMTERRLHATLERHGVKKLDPEPGEPLDPNRHQAAAQIPADQPKGRIAHVMQPGYVIGERTLRAAMVVVSAGPPEDQAQGEKNGGDRSGGGVDVQA